MGKIALNPPLSKGVVPLLPFLKGDGGNWVRRQIQAGPCEGRGNFFTVSGPLPEPKIELHRLPLRQSAGNPGAHPGPPGNQRTWGSGENRFLPPGGPRLNDIPWVSGGVETQEAAARGYLASFPITPLP